MMHINAISWAQLILIEIGAILHLAALCAFLRDTAKPNSAGPDLRKPQPTQHEERRCKLPEAHLNAKAVHYQRELHGVMEDVPSDIAPGMLAKTAKVNFKQTFKVHKEEHPFVPTVRW